jgi:tetratricopeptide (TPR) repeat protein
MLEKRSRGNPFHLEEITRQLIDSGDLYRDENGEWHYRPPSESKDLTKDLVSPFLMSALTRRLEKLPEKDQTLLALAAILEPGPEFDFELWVTVLGGEAQRPDAQATLQEALQRRLLREAGPNRYTFRPADIAGSLAATLPPERQRELHRQAAEVLVEKSGDPMLISYHFEQAGLTQEAVGHLEAAGARAAAANALDQAISCYKRVVQLTDHLPAFEMLGNLYRQRGDWSGSIAALQKAQELAEKQGNIEDLARVFNNLAFTHWVTDQYREAAHFASKVLKLDAVSTLEQATAYSHLGMVSWLLGHLREAEGWCKKAVDLLTTSNNEARLAAAYSRLGLVYLARAKLVEATRVTNQALEIRRRLQDYWGEAYCLASLGQIAAEQGQFDQALAYLVSAEQLFEIIKSPDGLMVIYTEQSRTLLRRGQVEEALASLSKSLHLAEEIGKRNANGLADIYILIAQASLAQNQVERANGALKDALKLVETAGNRRYLATGWALQAQIYQREGKVSQAEERYKKAIDLFEQVDHPAGLLRTRLEYSRFLTEQGKIEEATQLEQDVRHRAAQLGLYL